MQNNRIRLARLSEEESLDGDPDRLTPTPRLDDLLLQAVCLALKNVESKTTF